MAEREAEQWVQHHGVRDEQAAGDGTESPVRGEDEGASHHSDPDEDESLDDEERAERGIRQQLR